MMNIHMHLYTNIVLHVYVEAAAIYKVDTKHISSVLPSSLYGNQECKCVTSLKEPLQK